MNKQKWIVLVTAAGLLGTTAAAGAAGMVDKVSGLLRKDVVISVNGTDTSMKPVYINGKAYLPARDAASALGYDLNWNSKGREIELQQKNPPQAEEPVQYMKAAGVIVDVREDNGRHRIELMGKGPTAAYSWLILYADKETVLTDENGRAFAVADLKAGMHITADYGPMVQMSFPSTSHAANIVVGEQRLISEQFVQEVRPTDDGWQVHIGPGKLSTTPVTTILNVGKDATVQTAQGEPVEVTKLAPGTRVRAYYGPAVTKSIPAQSTAELIVVMPELLREQVTLKFLDLAWSNVPETEKSHLKTSKEQANVSLIDSQGAMIVGLTDEQKQFLAGIKDRSVQLVTVTYNTDQDALLGPLTVVIDPATMKVVGYFARY
ncbi:stalk domain-containing protein [Cohnella kolymensis]|nr:stalk domain-containing protein [Cohnella kolymensis]